MFDCFGVRDYGFICDVCGTPTGSCCDRDIAKDLCEECEKAVKAAREQVIYLKNLRKQNK